MTDLETARQKTFQMSTNKMLDKVGYFCVGKFNDARNGGEMPL
jgi:hypothetical protein